MKIAWYKKDKHKCVFIQSSFMSKESPPTPLTCFLKITFCQCLYLGYQEQSPSHLLPGGARMVRYVSKNNPSDSTHILLQKRRLKTNVNPRGHTTICLWSRNSVQIYSYLNNNQDAKVIIFNKYFEFPSTTCRPVGLVVMASASGAESLSSCLSAAQFFGHREGMSESSSLRMNLNFILVK